MQQIDVKFCRLDPQACLDLPLPSYETAHAAGMDVAAAVTEDVILQPGDISLIPTGFAVAIPEGFEIQIRPRSGLAVKHGISIINAPGTVDADYRGEVKIGLINLGREPFFVHRGDRIAQMILAPVYQARLQVVERLGNTGRGSGGFGHTGV
jgi:dUTP pyrophosphatase